MNFALQTIKTVLAMLICKFEIKYTNVVEKELDVGTSIFIKPKPVYLKFDKI